MRSLFLCVMAGIVPLLALWNSNLGQIPASAVWPNLLYTLLLVVIVFLVWVFIVRAPEQAALLSLVTLVSIFSYGHLYNLVQTSDLLRSWIGFVRLFVVVAAFTAAAWLWVIRRTKSPNLSLLFWPLSLLLLFNIISITVFAGRTRPADPVTAPAAAQPVSASAGESALPDIYYIVLDAYARQDILRDVIGYDNTPFLNALHERGFYVPECAYSNYDGTVVTLASVLNYDMLDHLHVPVNSQGEYQALNTALIHDNRARQTFAAYGYQFVTGRGYAPFNDIQNADVYLNYAIDQGIEDDLAEKRFTSLYLNTTVFRVLSELYQNNPERFTWLPSWLAVDPDSNPSLAEANFWYLQNNYMFDALETIPAKPGNFLVYAHINAPHGPYVYRRDGSFRYPPDDQDEVIRYADAVDYINRRVLAVIDTLQAHSSPPPVIILQGDHGIHKLTSGLDKHKILSAYYLPGNLSAPPYATLTPVNNFRLVLRNYFDPTVELLPDTLWVKLTNDYQSIPASCDTAP